MARRRIRFGTSLVAVAVIGTVTPLVTVVNRAVTASPALAQVEAPALAQVEAATTDYRRFALNWGV